MDMAYININIGEFVCEPPVFDSVVYLGGRYPFELTWSSEGGYYTTFDPNTVMVLHLKLVDPSGGGIVIFDQDIDIDAPFNANQYSVDLLQYGFSTKYEITFTLTLITSTCQKSIDYVIPGSSLNP